MKNLPNSFRLPKYDRLRLCNKNNTLRWCFRRTLVFYLFLTNTSLFLSETETKAAEQHSKKEDFGYEEPNASQLRSSAAHRALQEEEKGKRDEQRGDLQAELSINTKLSKRLRHLNRNKHQLSSDDEYSDSSSSDSNHCDVCPNDGPFRKRKYHFYILHDVTNVGLYDFFGGSNNGQEVESSVPVATVPITPITFMPVVPLPASTLPPVVGVPILTLVPTTAVPGTTPPLTTTPGTTPPVTTIPGTTPLPATLVPTTALPGTTPPTTALPGTTPPTTALPGTNPPTTALPGTTVTPATLAPTTLLPATLAPLSAAPIARLASSAAVESSSTAERSPSTESSPVTGRSSLWQWINDFLSRFY